MKKSQLLWLLTAVVLTTAAGIGLYLLTGSGFFAGKARKSALPAHPVRIAYTYSGMERTDHLSGILEKKDGVLWLSGTCFDETGEEIRLENREIPLSCWDTLYERLTSPAFAAPEKKRPLAADAPTVTLTVTGEDGLPVSLPVPPAEQTALHTFFHHLLTSSEN